MKKTIATALFAALALGGCQQQQPAPAATETAAEPDTKPGIALAGGRLVLPAVAGNPGAAYFEIDNRSGATVSIAAIAIDGVEKTEVHHTVGDTMAGVDGVEIAPGTSIRFEPGQLHVMAFNIAAKLKAGGTTEMTVTFADGDKLSAPLKIEPAGGAMAGMDH